MDESSKRTYFHNVETGASTWEVPDEIKSVEESAAPAPAEASVKMRGDWAEIVDKASGRPYYHNRKTNEITWTRPSSME